jgi:hypothetical protein
MLHLNYHCCRCCNVVCPVRYKHTHRLSQDGITLSAQRRRGSSDPRDEDNYNDGSAGYASDGGHGSGGGGGSGYGGGAGYSGSGGGYGSGGYSSRLH